MVLGERGKYCIINTSSPRITRPKVMDYHGIIISQSHRFSTSLLLSLRCIFWVYYINHFGDFFVEFLARTKYGIHVDKGEAIVPAQIPRGISHKNCDHVWRWWTLEHAGTTRYITGKKQKMCCCLNLNICLICSSAKNFRVLLVHYVFMNKAQCTCTHTRKGDTAPYMQHLRLLLIITHTRL